MTSQSHFGVSGAARQIGANPKDISDLFYLMKPSDERCPVVAGRRLIPADYLPEIERVLRAAGRPGPRPAPAAAS